MFLEQQPCHSVTGPHISRPLFPSLLLRPQHSPDHIIVPQIVLPFPLTDIFLHIFFPSAFGSPTSSSNSCLLACTFYSPHLVNSTHPSTVPPRTLTFAFVDPTNPQPPIQIPLHSRADYPFSSHSHEPVEITLNLGQSWLFHHSLVLACASPTLTLSDTLHASTSIDSTLLSSSWLNLPPCRPARPLLSCHTSTPSAHLLTHLSTPANVRILNPLTWRCRN